MNWPATAIQQKALSSQLFFFAFLFAVLTLCAPGSAAQSSPDSEAQPVHPSIRRIVVSFTDHKLALLEGDRVVKIYDIAVGTPDAPSPSGEFQIAQRLENPTYYHPGVVIGPGKTNPLGPRWIGLNIKGFGIHGTNRPGSIGKNASHGCIRLRNRDIKDLFARVQVGDHVSLIAERTDEIARLFGETPAPRDALETMQASHEDASSRLSETHGGR
jgi:hypothetical protein